MPVYMGNPFNGGPETADELSKRIGREFGGTGHAADVQHQPRTIGGQVSYAREAVGVGAKHDAVDSLMNINTPDDPLAPHGGIGGKYCPECQQGLSGHGDAA